MFKKICFCFVICALFGCSRILPEKQKQNVYIFRPYEVQTFENQEQSFNVAMLLPLSGKASTYGKGLQNAAMMAIEDTNNQNLEIRFYDTKSTPTGALEAFHQAVANKAKLVLGPLTADEVSAVAPSAKRESIPVISFSTSPQVLGNGVYTLGLLSEEQIKRIIDFSVEKGRKNIAVVLPDSASGLNMAKSAYDAALSSGANITKIGFYEPSTLEFSDLVKKMIATKDFDAVLIAETGSRLKAIAATFGYYDVAYPDVLFIGTSVWENTNLTKETTLYHGVYPSISRVHGDYFNKKYKDLFGELPNSLYAYAYDGVALASALSTKDTNHLNEYITNADGYIGINGVFKINTDGTNAHRLEVVEITENGIKTVSPAEQRFSAEVYHMPTYASRLPEIYGKNADIVYHRLQPQVTNTPYFNIF